MEKTALLYLSVFILASLSMPILTNAQGPLPGTSPGPVSNPSYPLTSNVSVFYNWLPVIIVAVFAAVGLTAIYYGLGALLNNQRVKTNAINEFYQVLGTVVVVIIILAIFSVYGSAIIADGPLTTALANICGSNQLGSANTMVNFLSSNSLDTATTGPTSQICADIVAVGQGSGITSKIDYGLGATYAIIANLTNQEAESLNAVNVFETYASTLNSFLPTESLCWPATCADTNLLPSGYIVYQYRPWSLYDKIRGMTLYVGAEALLSFYISIMQLIVIIMLLFAWPYILAAGIILRASFFTRKAGGLLIAIVIVAIILYPLLNLFEYASLSNTLSSPIGASKIPAFTLKGQAPCSLTSLFTGCGIKNPAPVIDYTDTKLNFYVLPNLEYVLNLDGCWPPAGNVFLSDALIAGAYSIPGYATFLAIKDIIGAFVSSLPSPPIPWFSCNPGNAIQSIVDLAKFYGMVFVTTVLLPVLNILILLSGVKNISSLLGGDTRILGLGKLV